LSPANNVQLLVALQDLDQMIREAEDTKNREALEKMGFPVSGLDELRKAHSKLESQLPPQLVRRYQRIKERTGRALVPVVDSTCTGCFTNVPAIFTSAINENKVMFCETCGRMLFWP